MISVHNMAFKAHEAGLCVVPVALDGTKRPFSHWKEFMRRLPSDEEIDQWFTPSRQTGFGYVCGAVSGGLEALDFDDAESWAPFEAAVEDHDIGDLWQRVTDGYLERMPVGGYHVLWRTAIVEGNQKLACRQTGSNLEVLIETRGEGGFIVVAPSHGLVHSTGRSYELLRGGITTIATITAEEREAILAVARMLDERERKVVRSGLTSAKGDRPGDRYNVETTWDELLTHYGWTRTYTHGDASYWRRPGKNIGVSATTNCFGSDLLHVFTTSTPLEADRSYDKFAFYTMMEHDGEFSAAARALAKEQSSGQPSSTEPPKHTASANSGSINRPHIVICSLASVQPREVDWLWPGWLARGKFHLLGGMAGDGKSTIAAEIAAIGSKGGIWPDGTAAPRFQTLFLLGEDSLEDTLRPRLDLHGADVSLIHAIEYVRDEHGRERFFSLQRHLELLEEAVMERRFDLIIVDPLTTIMMGSDRNAEGNVRDALTPLITFDQRQNVACLGIVHVGKPTGVDRSAAQRILGATAFVAMARVVWQTAAADNGGMGLGVTKANLTKKPETLLWSRSEDGRIAWHGSSHASIDDLMGASAFRPPGQAAEDFLLEFLASGPRSAKETESAARDRGISKRTLDRAKDALNVQSVKERKPQGRWIWALSSSEFEGNAMIHLEPRLKIATPSVVELDSFAETESLSAS